MKQPYEQFSVHDFVLDDAFRRWVFEPNEQSMTFWHTFMLQHPDKQADLDEASSLLLHLRANYDDLTDASQQRIQQVLDQAAAVQLAPEPISTTVRPLWQRRGFVWRMAASLTGVLLVAASVWYWMQPNEQYIKTAFGENRSVQLPDGSTVLLNGNSTLTFTDDWNADETREVWLEGEGFFKVAKKQAAGGRLKFVTHTPGLDITVLGTQFNVNTRRGNTAVTLVEGRVRLSKPGVTQSRIIEMKPGQVATTQPSIANVEVRDEKPQLHTAWTQRQFIFENTALRDIAQQLSDTYGLELVFEDSELADRRFTGNLSNESPETLLTTLSITFDLSIRRNGNRILLQRSP
ncbi:FecR family protein [Spirosoma montaniterrae]|uniref:Iron dicitrate transport regulator FecR n=1 Tax=Spirosoma montaniterrae TaxID=1178516 RepID=A0A1P9WXC7_9BACT|nr:FecR domain-containing protein [Spirosoma montaniterrae]AQG79968.1 iron dicitrate transport regulator FecR [Spirosoma montaniterrae]